MKLFLFKTLKSFNLEFLIIHQDLKFSIDTVYVGFSDYWTTGVLITYDDLTRLTKGTVLCGNCLPSSPVAFLGVISRYITFFLSITHSHEYQRSNTTSCFKEHKQRVG